ncbi:zinc finger C3HC4-type RING finger family protein [Striga asiatica]|uniref:Zinc finger C3HC4-type RING finger family protein n=1 Tax=Striga asiatica TaxID=4170 RepID=A0A5A7PI72_STRAF|nr:zinc finger C3HC4-type RING finger family protein [Striga asiatica]
MRFCIALQRHFRLSEFRIRSPHPYLDGFLNEKNRYQHAEKFSSHPRKSSDNSTSPTLNRARFQHFSLQSCTIGSATPKINNGCPPKIEWIIPHIAVETKENNKKKMHLAPQPHHFSRPLTSFAIPLKGVFMLSIVLARNQAV